MKIRDLPSLTSIQPFIDAIKENNLPFIKEHPAIFSKELKEYFVLIAAKYQRTEIMLELVNEKKIGFGAAANWFYTGEYSPPPLLNGLPPELSVSCYDVLRNAFNNNDLDFFERLTALFKQFLKKTPNYFYSSSTRGTFTLLDAVKANDLAYVRLFAPLLATLISFGDEEQLEIAHEAMLNDNAEMLDVLVSHHVVNIIEPYTPLRRYNWMDQFLEEDDNDEPYYAIPDPSSDVKYDSVFLAAANHQKLKSLRWILENAEKHSELMESGSPYIYPINIRDELYRVYELADTRPALRGFLIDRGEELIHRELCGGITADGRDEMEMHFKKWDKGTRHNVLNDTMSDYPHEVLVKLIDDEPDFSFETLMNIFAAYFNQPNPALEALLAVYLVSDLRDESNDKSPQQTALAIVCLAEKTKKNQPVSRDEIQSAIDSFNSLPANTSLQDSAYRFLLMQVLGLDDTALFLKLFALSKQKQFAVLNLGTAKTFIMKAAKADAINTFIQMYRDHHTAVADDTSWWELQTLSEQSPNIKKYLKSFSLNPACEHPNHFKVFSQTAIKVRNKDGKLYKAILVEETSDASDDDTFVLKG